MVRLSCAQVTVQSVYWSDQVTVLYPTPSQKVPVASEDEIDWMT